MLVKRGWACGPTPNQFHRGIGGLQNETNLTDRQFDSRCGCVNLPHSRVRGPYRDEDVLAAASEPIQRLEGPPGTALLIDTSRCLHYGSRVAEGHERFSMHVVFRRYHSVHETPFNVFAEPRFEADAVRRAAMSSPDRLPRGWYYPDPSLGPKARGGKEPAG